MSHETSKDKDISCSKCGRKLTSLKEWITDDKKNFFCDVCYQILLFPDLKDDGREILDYGTLPSET